MAEEKRNDRRRSDNRPRSNDRGREKSSFTLDMFNKNCKSWIQDNFDYETIKFSEELGQELVENKVTTTQVRNIFAEIQRIKLKAKNDNFDIKSENFKDFLLLKPKMAYVTQKANRGQKGLEILKKVINETHKHVIEIPNNKTLNNFCDLFEAIIAYHKASGARNS